MMPKKFIHGRGRSGTKCLGPGLVFLVFLQHSEPLPRLRCMSARLMMPKKLIHGRGSSGTNRLGPGLVFLVLRLLLRRGESLARLRGITCSLRRLWPARCRCWFRWPAATRYDATANDAGDYCIALDPVRGREGQQKSSTEFERLEDASDKNALCMT